MCQLLRRVRLCEPVDCSPPAPLCMGFSRQGYWSGVPLPSPGDLPDSGTDPWSPTLQADTLPSEPPGKPIRHFILLLHLPWCLENILDFC